VNRVATGFDRISFVYDKLVWLVYGNSIAEAQKYFLPHIPQRSTVLILGGGTGWILTEIGKQKMACEIWYIDASDSMIRLSKKRKTNEQIHFITGTENEIPASVRFDIVITNFYLDLFPEDKLKEVIDKITFVTHPESRWIVTDFVNNKKWWQSIMLKSMYFFFMVVCKIEAGNLPDWHLALRERGFIKKESKLFYGNFIESAIYAP